MIDFKEGGFFARLKKVDSAEFNALISDFFIAGEIVIGAYKSVRDGVVFTTKRIRHIHEHHLTI